MTVWALIEHHCEGDFLHSIYESKRAGLKNMLILKRRQVVEHLEARILHGKQFRDLYKNTWVMVTVRVTPFEVISDI